MVSDKGRIKSLERTIVRKDGQKQTKCEKIMVGSVTSDGYRSVKLSRNDSYKCVGIHRLVAEAFIENPNNLSDVHHKDFDRTNNAVSNLAWCSHADNVRHSIDAGRHVCTKDLTGKNNPNFGNHKLHDVYKDKAYAIKMLSRPRGQNGRAKRIVASRSGCADAEFACILDCAEYIKQKHNLSVKVKSMRGRIANACKTNTQYMGYSLKFAE